MRTKVRVSPAPAGANIKIRLSIRLGISSAETTSNGTNSFGRESGISIISGYSREIYAREQVNSPTLFEILNGSFPSKKSLLHNTTGLPCNFTKTAVVIRPSSPRVVKIENLDLSSDLRICAFSEASSAAFTPLPATLAPAAAERDTSDTNAYCFSKSAGFSAAISDIRAAAVSSAFAISAANRRFANT